MARDCGRFKIRVDKRRFESYVVMRVYNETSERSALSGHRDFLDYSKKFRVGNSEREDLNTQLTVFTRSISFLGIIFQ